MCNGTLIVLVICCVHLIRKCGLSFVAPPYILLEDLKSYLNQHSMVRKFLIECVLHSRCPVVTDIGWLDTVAIVGITAWAWAWELRELMKVYISIVKVELPRDCAHLMVREFETLL